MASGAGIIKNEFLKLADSLDQAFRGLILRIVGGGDEQLRLSLDSEVHSLLAHFAERGQMTLEEATICWLDLQANAYQLTKNSVLSYST